MTSSPAAVLLDSHVLLWWWFDPERLSPVAMSALTDSATPVLVSAATV